MQLETSAESQLSGFFHELISHSLNILHHIHLLINLNVTVITTNPNLATPITNMYRYENVTVGSFKPNC